MKTFYHIIILSLLLMTACANTHVPKAKVTIRSVTQDGVPIIDEPVRIGFSSWGGVYGKTDQNGCFTAEGRPTSDYLFAIGRMKVDEESPKYYATYFRKDIAHWKDYPEDGKWKPWNETIEVVVKEKLNPIPMYANGNNFKTNIPVIDEWVGYDFEYNDWVAPHGKGLIADIEVFLSEAKPTEEDEIEELKIRFPYPLAGAYVMKKDLNCDFKSVYHANPGTTYQQEIRWYTKLQTKDELNHPLFRKERRFIPTTRIVENEILSKDDYLIFRTRTKVDEDGNLIEARYGKIYGPIEFRVDLADKRPSYRKRVELSNYYFNPTINDTNLEYDSKRNLLFDKVTPRERASYLRLWP